MVLPNPIRADIRDLIPVQKREAALSDGDAKIELAALRLEIVKQIAIADRLGAPHLATILCEAEACIDTLVAAEDCHWSMDC